MTDKPRKLTIKQKKFVKAYVETNGNGRGAALLAYDTNSSDVANAIAVENLQKPSIAQAVEAELEKQKITMEAAIKPIADALKATRSVASGDEVYESVDHSTRLKASGMALKLLGAEQKIVEPPAGSTFIQINQDMRNKYDD